MKKLSIPLLLVAVLPVAAVLLDYYVLNPGHFGWLSYVAFFGGIAIVALVVGAGLRNELKDRNRPGLWLLLLCAAAATACNRSTAPAWAYSQHAKEYRAKEAEAHERAIVYTAPPFGCDSLTGWCGRVTW